MTSKDFYESLWHNVGDWENTGGAFRNKVPEKEFLNFVDYLKERYKTGTVLDIGCGGGRNSVALAKAGFKVTGIDYSESAIELAKKLAKEKDVDINFKVSNIIDEDPGEYDIIIDLGCFHHVRPENWKKYLEHLHFKKIYYLYCFSVNCPDVRGYTPHNKENFIEYDGNYVHFFKEEELKKLFGKNIQLNEVSKGNTKKFWEVKVNN